MFDDFENNQEEQLEENNQDITIENSAEENTIEENSSAQPSYQPQEEEPSTETEANNSFGFSYANENISEETAESVQVEQVNEAEEEIKEEVKEEVKEETTTEPTQVAPPTYTPPYGQYQYNPVANQRPNSPYYGQPNYQGGYNYQYQPQYQPNHYAQPQQPVENKSQKKGKKIFFSIVALVLVFALGVGVSTVVQKGNKSSNNSSGKYEVENSEESTTGDNAKLEINESPVSQGTSGKELTPAQVYEKLRKSNVGVVVYSSSSSKVAGEGSGIVMGLDSTGKYTYVITCAHVISDSGISVKVQTEDGTNYDAKIIGYDERTDVGVLRVETTKLVAAEFGDSSSLSIGDPVYAIGNPGGVDFFGSFTTGHVSAINRPVNSEIGYTMKCIQHNAAINPGNSGGMLVNQYGQVVGINSQKIASSSYEGMGFAVPISSAKEIIESLIKYSYVPNRPKLGISYLPVSASQQYYMIAQVKGLPAGTLIISDINSDSSLVNTNVRKYDMIIAVNGKPLDKAETLLSIIDNGKVGDKITLTLCRVNSNYSVEEFDVDVTLVEDKGKASQETTTQAAANPFDYYYGYGN